MPVSFIFFIYVYMRSLDHLTSQKENGQKKILGAKAEESECKIGFFSCKQEAWFTLLKAVFIFYPL